MPNWYLKVAGKVIELDVPWQEFPVLVYVNPNPQQLATMTRKYQECRCFLVGTNMMYAWSAYESVHQGIANALNIKGIPLLCYTYGGKIMSVTVTDNSRNSDWHHNPQVAQAITSNQPFMALTTPDFANNLRESVSYYDDGINGNWQDMQPQETAQNL